MTSNEYIQLLRLIEEKCGLFLGEEKAYLLESKFAKLLSESSFGSIAELYAKIDDWNDPELIDNIIEAVTVNETFWFRDKAPWLILEEMLLPIYILECREGKRDKVRIWSAACSYGQEPYSIAMCIDHYLKCHEIHDLNLGHFDILATDISCKALRTAKAGRYDSFSVQRGLDSAYKLEYFNNEGKIWSINQKIKDSVRFQQLNLILDGFPNHKFDLIFARNILIYFTDQQKKEMMDKIKDALKPEGILFIGSSELLTDCSRNFSMVQHKNGIYFRMEE